MKLTFHLVLAVTGLLTCSVNAAQAEGLKPGLWQISQKMGGNPEMDRAQAQMQEQMAAMPPEQRKMMEDMMAKRGVKMGASAGGGTTIQMCMTPEMAARSDAPTMTHGHCKNTISARTATGMKIAFACTEPPSSGEGQITFAGSDAYSMKMTIHTTANGKPEQMTMDASGKWLGVDCGSIKPIKVPKP